MGTGRRQAPVRVELPAALLSGRPSRRGELIGAWREAVREGRMQLPALAAFATRGTRAGGRRRQRRHDAARAAWLVRLGVALGDAAGEW